MKPLNISFIDEETYLKLKNSPATVHSIFNSSMNVTVAGTLITISSIASNHKHIIRLYESINFTSLNISVGQKFTLENNCLRSNNLVFNIEQKSIYFIPPYYKKYQLNTEHIKVLDDLKKWMKKQNKTHLDHYDQKDKTLRYQFEKIDTFLKKQDFISAKNLIGLGIGLTPIGDDILFGYLIAKQSIGEQPFDQYEFLSYAKKQTNIISYQFLEDIMNHHYSYFYQSLLENFFTRKSINKLKELINFGETSGMAILTGFIYGLQKRSV